MLAPALMRTFAAVADTVVPQGGPFPEGAADVDVVAALRIMWPELQPVARRNIVALLLCVDAAALLRTGRLLHRLGPAARLRVCDWLEHRSGDPMRSAYNGLKTLVLVMVAGDPRIEQRLGTADWPPQLLRR